MWDKNIKFNPVYSWVVLVLFLSWENASIIIWVEVSVLVSLYSLPFIEERLLLNALSLISTNFCFSLQIFNLVTVLKYNFYIGLLLSSTGLILLAILYVLRTFSFSILICCTNVTIQVLRLPNKIWLLWVLTNWFWVSNFYFFIVSFMLSSRTLDVSFFYHLPFLSVIIYKYSSCYGSFSQ